MVNTNPANSTQLANSIQRDYNKAAEAHRLAKESDPFTKNNFFVKVGLTLSVLKYLI